MSLHLGNLPPRVRKDELERVFRQFGRCSVLLRDGYGFAVYDFEGDAEAALRALKGKKICGQTLDLSWSDKQPKPHVMMPRDRNPESHGNRQKFAGLNEDRPRFDPNRVGTGNRKVSDRYQRDYDEERGGKSDLGQFGGKNRRAHHDSNNTRGSQACFRCGAVGHKIRDCPSNGALNERRSNHSEEKGPESGAHDEVRGRESRSRDRLGSVIQVESKVELESEEKYNCRKRRREQEDLVEEPDDRKVRRTELRQPRSGDASPKWDPHSRSQEPLSMAGSQSVSRSSLPHSLSVSSRSKRSRSRSKSRSSSRSSSLSVSRGQSVQSPTLDEERENGSPAPKSKEILTEINKLFEPDDGDNYPIENGTDTLSDNQQPELDLVDYDPDPNLIEPFEDNPIILENNGDSDPVVTSSSGSGARLRISPSEVNRVLKHYGLKQQSDNDEHIDSIEDYFGCARMWPWELVYYRRHKKGLVSSENHARRVAQNTEFGIVDKFVRSSSGWFEPVGTLLP